jgi:hypothetical protein
MAETEKLFARIRVEDITLPGAVAPTTVDVLANYITLTDGVWDVGFKLFLSGTDFEIAVNQNTKQMLSSMFPPLVMVEGVMRKAMVAMIPPMLGAVKPPGWQEPTPEPAQQVDESGTTSEQPA